MTNDEYARLQEMWLEATGVKKGDWVKVMRAAEDHESGWNNSWTPGMDAVVGTFVQVLGSWDTNGIEVASGKFSPSSYRVPFFILDPTGKPKQEKYQFAPFERVLGRDDDNKYHWGAFLAGLGEDDLKEVVLVLDDAEPCIPAEAVRWGILNLIEERDETLVKELRGLSRQKRAIQREE
jgi:hypothetical protein